jgi:hypothetical protein
MKGRPVTFEQKRYLLHVYLTQGLTAASPAAISYGISPKSISKWARLAGHKGKRGREVGVHRGGRHNDPRWSKAIERGAVAT